MLDGWIDQGQLHLNWQINEGYYLYRHRFDIKLAGQDSSLLEASSLPEGKPKVDEYFGEVEAYYYQAEMKLPLTASAPLQSSDVLLALNYQGCAEAGLCYPPQTRYVRINNGEVSISKDSPLAAAVVSAPLTAEQGFTELLENAGLASIIGLFYLAGLALTFTPCVLPMVPILSSIIMGSSEPPGRKRAFALSLTYVLAMASTYALAGTLTGYFGAELNLQAKLQSPVTLSVFAALFVILSLAMFGLYELRLPAFVQDRLNRISQKQSGGNYLSVGVIGVLSSLIVSPCVSAPLAGALVYISVTGDPGLGGLALLALGSGHGTPLLIIGTLGAEILPRAGQWMDQVKVAFGILLLGVAIWMLSRFIPGPISLGLWAALFIGYAWHLGALRGHKHLRTLLRYPTAWHWYFLSTAWCWAPVPYAAAATP